MRALRLVPSAVAAIGLVSLALTAGCRESAAPGDPVAARSATASGLPRSGFQSAPTASSRARSTPHEGLAPPPEPAGDATVGRALVAQFECGRCHDGLSDEVPAVPVERHCTHCHQKVMAGGFDHKPHHERWKKNVAHLQDVPSLKGAGARFRYEWLVGYLMAPEDLRPHLAYSMPALDLDRGQARDIATFLMHRDPEDGGVVPARHPIPSATAEDLEGADAARGKALLGEKGCTGCHHFSGVPSRGAAPGPTPGAAAGPIALAPDLRHTRDRMTPSALQSWLRDPRAVKPDTAMPTIALTDEEVRDLAAFILTAGRDPADPAPTASTDSPAPMRAEDDVVAPPPLARQVRYDEVEARVLSKTCRHCHGDPDVAMGDGGPGNTGGFGYAPIGLELTSFGRVLAGMVGPDGTRHSIFTRDASTGTPRLVAALVERHREVAGHDDPGVRGMPLALPPLPWEDIRLVVTWIQQGRRR